MVTWRQWTLTLLLTFSVLDPWCSREARGEPTATPLADVKQWEDPTYALSLLQDEHKADGRALLHQADLDFLIADSGGGACATAAAINVMQAMRIMADLDALPDLHRVALAVFSKQHELLKGRVSNEAFTELIGNLQTYLDGETLKVEIESAPNSKYANGSRTWPKNGPSLQLRPREITVISYTVSKADGTVIGRHFVLLKKSEATAIAVVDPSAPAGKREYVIQRKRSAETDATQIFLVRPAHVKRLEVVFELNTVFRVSLSDDVAPPLRRSRKGLSAASLKTRFDNTEAALRGTKDHLSPRKWREITAQFGLPGLDLPVEHGGLGWKPSEVLEIFRHAGEHNLNYRDVVGGAHVRPLLRSNQPEVLAIVRQVAEGKGYIAIAITEPTAGSDVAAIKSSARKVQGGFLLSGEKRFNARLNEATHVILFTQGTTGQSGKLSVFVVPINQPGLEIERLTAHGLTGNSFGGLRFNDLFVPDSHLIGTDGEGLRVFFEHFLYWRLMQTAAAIGTGQQALQQMAERIKSREAFGGPIGRFTHLQQPLGQHTTELQMAYALAKEAALMLDRGEYAAARASICGLKAEGVEVALKAVDAAMRAFGGEGYSTSVDLGDRLRDLNGLRIADGTTDVMRMEVVRQTFGQEFWEMGVHGRD